MTPPSNAGGEWRAVLAREVLKHLREQERVGMFGKKGRIITFGEAADVIESLLAARENADDRAPALVEAAVGANMAVKVIASALCRAAGMDPSGAARSGYSWINHADEAREVLAAIRALLTPSQEASNVG